MTLRRFVPLALLVLPLSAIAARLAPSAVTSSSAYPDEGGVSYEAARATDGKLSTAWVEGDAGGGLGAWLEIDLGSERTIQKIKVWGGLWSSADFWKRANRPKEIEFAYADGSKDTFQLKDEMKVQEFQLPQARTSKTVRARIRGVYDGTTWLDTAISEIQVFDAAEGQAPVRSGAASSTLTEGGITYDAMQAADGISDSMWCEGNKTGDGTNEWVELTFPTAQSVSKLTVVNGVGSSMANWMKSNRATAATLTFSDGSTAPITLKNSMMAQTVEFPAKTTSKVRVTFTTVAKGKEFNDLCMSELVFAP